MKPLRIQVVEHPHPELNEFGFIVPGLGDAGDRYFGTGSNLFTSLIPVRGTIQIA
jgi:hypothetical protein